MEVKRGDVVQFDFGPRSDSRMEGPHPAIIVQTDLINSITNYSLTILVAVSSVGKEMSPSHVKLEPSEENGLTNTCFAKCEQVFTVPKDQIKEVRGSLSKGEVYRINEALRVVLSL